MPKILQARPPANAEEESLLRKLANSRRAPVEQVERARTIVESWDGASTAVIATHLGCHQQTVRDRIARFNVEGFGSVVERPSGRKPRLTEEQRRTLISLAERPPHLAYDTMHSDRDVQGPSPSQGASRPPRSWTLDALVAAARRHGISVGRSQVRRILLAAGIRWDLHQVEAPAHVPAYRTTGPSSRVPGRYG